MSARPPGAFADGADTIFRVFSTAAAAVQVRLFADPARPTSTHDLASAGDGWFEGRVRGAGPGVLYKFVLDGRDLPDPYARFLPYGVDGPAEVVAPGRRSHSGRVVAAPTPTPPPLERYVVYELHVGTFTPAGTYAAAAERLEYLADLGVTAVELMPIAAFAGERGWGYDGVAHYAPFAPYGRPEELRAFVDRAHALGLGVLVDVVYNHFGPKGNYLGQYAPEYFTSAHANPWGGAPNFAFPAMRRYVTDNARMWFDEYGFDGLRLDATHMMKDTSPEHILRELRTVASSYRPAKVLIAEDERNEPSLVTDVGLDAVWADDFHHAVRVVLTGERDGYYGAYEPTLETIARAIERGWLYEGQTYAPWGAARGKPADGLDAKRFVYCVENHDQVGNRALGERLDRDSSVEALCAATCLLLFLPMTPLLFMGQEWAATSPFLYFTDHDPELGKLVSRGRREEFRKFRAFADEEARLRIPDPQAAETFLRSKLDWNERARPSHARAFDAIRAMLRLRRGDAVLRAPTPRSALRARVDGGLLVVERQGEGGRRVLFANLSAHTVTSDAARRASSRAAEALFRVGDVHPGSFGAYAIVVASA